MSTAKKSARTGKQAENGAESGQRSSKRRSLVTREILDHATRLFADQGYEATSLQDVADALGVSRSGLYHYVSRKEDLLAMLVEQMSRGLADSLAVLHARTDLSAQDKLREFTGSVVRQRASSPDQFRVLDQVEAMLPEPLRSQHFKARKDVLTELTGVIEDGIAGGEFKPLDARIAALSVLGMCNWVAWWYRPGHGTDLEPVARQISQSVADMLLATEGGNAGSARSALAQARSSLDALERLIPNEE
ncbi:TetR/AcrR family transcriptional regulator [Sciscionella sediminilitoris]|uniref:TetR/AcrR family transcriptional regulator n=1 Tax=Sciscionella sediminilitoris TaxID=1445613 RepID=UPI0004DF58D8|nr:TetR/AcrR family transcriptional regulator [Sciscionella sp. SE31]